jgi:hypothetical protein
MRAEWVEVKIVLSLPLFSVSSLCKAGSRSSGGTGPLWELILFPWAEFNQTRSGFVDIISGLCIF